MCVFIAESYSGHSSECGTPYITTLFRRTSLGLNYLLYLAMDPGVQQEINHAIQRNNQELLASMSQLTDQKIGALKRSSEESSRQQLEEIKKMKLGQSIDFKKKANKDQYLHNAEVLQAVESSKVKLENQNTQGAIKDLDEGISLSENRQKLILIADQSPFGWLTVNNYKSNALASYEEDENRLTRAENRACQESKRRNAAKPAKFNDQRNRQSIPTIATSTVTA